MKIHFNGDSKEHYNVWGRADQERSEAEIADKLLLSVRPHTEGSSWSDAKYASMQHSLWTRIQDNQEECGIASHKA